MKIDYKNKKVLILGLGLNQGGVGASKFFAQFGADVRITDLKAKKELKTSLDQLKKFKKIKYILGKHQYEDVDWADLIIKNQAIKPSNPYLKYALKNGKVVETDMEIFLQFVKPEQVVGITGTKGKSTTASLIYQILALCHLKRSEGYDRIIFAGNIGKSVLDTISQITPTSLIILELSSFQLEAFQKYKVSPKWAVITNIFPDHLNYYKSFKNYTDSKKPIARFQKKGDFLFLKKGDPITGKKTFNRDFKGKKIYFDAKDLAKNFTPLIEGGHNRENIAAAVAVAKTLGIKRTKAMQVIEGFKGVEYRLQKIYDKAGIKIYNDSAATNPDATIQALKTLASHHPGGNLNILLIAGGVNKNLSYQWLAKAIEKYAKAVYLLEGSATEAIKKHLLTNGGQTSTKNMETYNNLSYVLKIVMQQIKTGDTVLFSPGAASFNLFQNEFDRGRKFNKAVEKVFGSKYIKTLDSNSPGGNSENNLSHALKA